MIRRSTRRTSSSAPVPRRRGRTSPRRRRSETRLDGAGHPHLAPVGWAVGRPLRDFLNEGPLPTAETVAVTLAVLSALGSLHREGRSHGAVSEDAVGIAADGWVRLAADAAATSRRGPAGDLKDTGALLCRMLGVSPTDEASGPPAGAARNAPALVAVARSIAAGGAQSADEAWSSVKEAAGYWGSEPQLVAALAALADRVDGATPLERAVTKVVIGPPLRGEPPPPAPGRQSGGLGLPSLAALPEVSVPKVSVPKVSVPKLSVPKVSLPAARRPGRKIVILGAVALLAGVLVGGIAGVRGLRVQSRNAAAAQAPQPKHSSPAKPAAQPAGLYAQTPDAAVSTFFQLVRDQKLDQAALLWKPKMASAVDLQGRFSGITGIDLRRDEIVAEDDSLGVATVEVDWVETHADGSAHEYIGEIYVDTGPLLWRWDSWRVHEVFPDSGGGGDGG